MPQAALRAGEVVRQALRLRDVGFHPASNTVYLLGGKRSLERLLGNQSAIWPLLQRRVSGYDRYFEVHTWDDLEALVLGTLATLSRLPGVKTSWGEQGYFEGWEVIPIPSPGGPQKRWVSVKAGGPVPPVQFEPFRACDQEPVPFGGGPSNRGLLLESGFAGLPLMLSHSIETEQLERAVTRCNGNLLWPSWALSWRIPAGYGDVTFLANLTSAFAGLKGFSSNRDKRVTLHGSDAWTFDTRQLLRWEKAVNHELRGDAAWWAGGPHDSDSDNAEWGAWGRRGLQSELIGGHFGADDVVGGWAPDNATLLTSVRGVRRRMRDLIDFYRRAGRELPQWAAPSPVSWKDPAYVRVDWTSIPWDDRGGFSDGLSAGDRYDYAELKVQGNVAIADLPLVIYPAHRARKVERLLDQAGFRGWRLKVSAAAARRELGEGDPGLGPNFEADAGWANIRTAALLDWALTIQRTGYPPKGVAIPESVAYETRHVREWVEDELPTMQRGGRGRWFSPWGAVFRGYDYAWGSKTNIGSSGYIPMEPPQEASDA